jgi:putative acetyltransferase
MYNGVGTRRYDAAVDGWTLLQDDPRAPDVVALLERHLEFARQVTPPEDVHALDLDGLLDESVTFFSVREDGVLLGIGAIKALSPTHMELKSIHTAVEARGRGVGRTLVEHLVAEAGEQGATRVSLETGAMDEFAPSRALYSSAGFEECEAFGDYSPSRNSTFMTRSLR